MIALISAPLAAAVEPLQLLQAKTLNYVTKSDSSYVHLVGDVRFRKGNILINSDEAFHYEDKGLLILEKHVDIRDEQNRFSGDRILYRTRSDELSIPGRSRTEFNGRVLHADRLKADLENDHFTALSNVFLQDSTRTIICDTLHYYDRDESADILGHAVIRDSTENSVFSSDKFYYSMKDNLLRSLKRGEITRLDSTGQTIFTLVADSIQTLTQENIFIATDSVILHQDSLEARCDSFYFSGDDQQGSLHQNPRIRQQDASLRGKDIFIGFRDNEIHDLEIVGNARMENTDTGYLRQDSSRISRTSYLTGLRLLGSLENRQLSRIRMEGMASSNYHVFEDSVYQGLNSSSGDTVVMDFDDGALKEISILAGARGTYFPNHAAVTMDTTLTYSSDNIYYRLDNRQTRLAKNSVLVFGDLTLRADTIRVNWNENLLYALPEVTDTGLVHFPEMEQKGDRPLVGDELIYNLKTRRGKIVEGRTQYDDGYYQGENILNRDNKAFFVKDGKYSTCDQRQPHFWIESRRMKLIPQDKVFAQPLILKIHGIPVFALPFGFFPAHGGGRQSGWIMPSYGYRAASGRFLRNGGYYWAPSDYFDTRMLLNFYDKWGILANSNTRYALRYQLNGNISFKYKRYFLDDNNSTSYDINVLHAQTMGKNSRLSISGRYTNDRSFYNTTGVTLDERLNQKLISNATYSTRFGPFSFSANLSRTEDLITGNVSSTLPNISLSKGIAPLFKAKSSSAPTKWYNDLTYNINSRLTNTYSSTLQPDSSFLETRKNGLISTASLQLKRKVFKFLSLTPSLNYKDGLVYKYKQPVLVDNIVQRDASGSIMLEEVPDIKHRGTYDFSTSASTKLYGIFRLNMGKLLAIRHVLSPSLTYQYTPDFSRNENYVFHGADSSGKAVSYDYFRDSSIGATSSNQSQVLSYSIGNQFAAKIQGKKDKPNKYDFLTLSFSGSYNMTADSLRLSPVSLSYRASKLPGNLQFNGSFHYDPYRYDTVSNRRVNTLLPFPRLTFFSFDTGFQLKDGKEASAETRRDSTQAAAGRAFSQWSAGIGIRYSYSASNPTLPNRNLTIDGNFSAHLTPGWKISYRANFDLVEQRLTYHNLVLDRDLHCWTFKFTWTPSGPGASYYLLIQVKAPTLKDLKVEERSGRSVYY